MQKSAMVDIQAATFVVLVLVCLCLGNAERGSIFNDNIDQGIG